jgi:hypothetical protein
MKQLPNLIDLSEMKKEIQESLFNRYSVRVNTILGIAFLFCLLLFIYIGFKTRNSETKEDTDKNEYDVYDEIPPPNLYTYSPTDYISQTMNLALMS